MIVNGTVVVDNGKVLPVRPGQSIRFPVQKKGRLVAVDVNKWLGEHTLNVPALQFDDTGAGQSLQKK